MTENIVMKIFPSYNFHIWHCMVYSQRPLVGCSAMWRFWGSILTACLIGGDFNPSSWIRVGLSSSALFSGGWHSKRPIENELSACPDSPNETSAVFCSNFQKSWTIVWHKCQWHAWRGPARGSPGNLYSLIEMSQLPKTK